MSYFLQPHLDESVGCHIHALADFITNCTHAEIRSWPSGDHEMMIDLMTGLSALADDVSKTLCHMTDANLTWTHALGRANALQLMEEE